MRAPIRCTGVDTVLLFLVALLTERGACAMWTGAADRRWEGAFGRSNDAFGATVTRLFGRLGAQSRFEHLSGAVAVFSDAQLRAPGAGGVLGFWTPPS